MSILQFSDYAPVSLFEILKARRGWTDESIAALNAPPTELLANLETAAQFLRQVEAGQVPITVMPDFDTDGVTAGTLLYAGLAQLGFNVSLYAPDYSRGHDITVEAVDELFNLYPDTQVVITCDAGTNSHAGVSRIHEYGAKVVVTDHHVELEPGSNADFLVNPCAIGESFSQPFISGAVVAYLVLEFYAATYQPTQSHLIRYLRLFAGIGTVADVMDLSGLNRELVRDAVAMSRLCYPQDDGVSGVSVMSRILGVSPVGVHPVFYTAFAGFTQLLEVLVSRRKLRDVDDIDEQFFGFYIAPMINSLRRVEADPLLAFNVLNHPDASVRAASCVDLFDANERRKYLVDVYVDELLSSDQPFAPVIYLSDAPSGMRGLIASKLMDAHQAPVLVLAKTSEGGFAGSARAPEWFDVIGELASIEVEALGHAQACGVNVSSAQDLAQVAAFLSGRVSVLKTQFALREVALADRVDLIVGPTQGADATLAATADLVDVVQRLEAYVPFGKGFRYPVVAAQLYPHQAQFRSIGAKSQHLKLTSVEGFTILAWNVSDADRELLDEAAMNYQLVSAIGRLEVNEFRGRVSPQLIVDSFQIEE